jgi:hypothetical protein
MAEWVPIAGTLLVAGEPADSLWFLVRDLTFARRFEEPHPLAGRLLASTERPGRVFP